MILEKYESSLRRFIVEIPVLFLKLTNSKLLIKCMAILMFLISVIIIALALLDKSQLKIFNLLITSFISTIFILILKNSFKVEKIQKEIVVEIRSTSDEIKLLKNDISEYLLKAVYEVLKSKNFFDPTLLPLESEKYEYKLRFEHFYGVLLGEIDDVIIFTRNQKHVNFLIHDIFPEILAINNKTQIAKNLCYSNKKGIFEVKTIYSEKNREKLPSLKNDILKILHQK